MMTSLLVKNKFMKLVCAGIAANYFFYVLINIGMVTQLFPVVGVPLPLVSFGGTVIITVMMSFGIALNCKRNAKIENITI